MKKHVITAITLNIIYPGAGYLYLRDSDRRPIALFLTLIWTILVATVIYELIKGSISGQFYFFASPVELPALAVVMWVVMCIDTYRLARRKSK